MNKDLYSVIGEVFSDAYCEKGKTGVAMLYAEIRLRADNLLKTYLEEDEDEDEDEDD